jgi:hypothetical protein
MENNIVNSDIVFKKLEENDLTELEIFCLKCKELGYHNNSSFQTIKLSLMKMPYGQYFIGYDNHKKLIFNLSGVHVINEINLNSYRTLFRGASLPEYTLGKLGLASSYQFTKILNLQIDFILNYNNSAEFYITTNKEKSETNAKSHRLDSIYGPKAEKLGLITKINDEFDYMNTKQTLWKVNVEKYKEWINQRIVD